MAARRALLGALLLLGSAGQAHPSPESRIPSPPAERPPEPPRLTALPTAPGVGQPGPPAAPRRPLALPPSVSPLPGGGWRVALGPDAAAPDEAARLALAEIARRLAAETVGRVALLSQVSRAGDTSSERRRALDRAVAAKAALVAGGLEETRVDVFPIGRTPLAMDVLDILPPGAARMAP